MTVANRRVIAVVCVIVGAALLIPGLIFGFGKVDYKTVDCGSGFSGLNSKAALTADYASIFKGTQTEVSEYQDACSSAVSSRKTTAWALTAPALVLVAAGGLLALSTMPTASDGTTPGEQEEAQPS